MTISETIQKAIEGGYKYHGGDMVFWQEVVLKPEFWQSLGKALGWEEVWVCQCGETETTRQYIGETGDGYDICNGCGRETDNEDTAMEYWLAMWHRFIDHLADGKSPGDFFKQL